MLKIGDPMLLEGPSSVQNSAQTKHITPSPRVGEVGTEDGSEDHDRQEKARSTTEGIPVGRRTPPEVNGLETGQHSNPPDDFAQTPARTGALDVTTDTGTTEGERDGARDHQKMDQSAVDGPPSQGTQ